MVMQLNNGAEQSLSELRDAPSARVGYFCDQSSDVQAFEQPADTCRLRTRSKAPSIYSTAFRLNLHLNGLILKSNSSSTGSDTMASSKVGTAMGIPPER